MSFLDSFFGVEGMMAVKRIWNTRKLDARLAQVFRRSL
jgi:hypothetical protein